jgi:electron transport complex protein RnfG
MSDEPSSARLVGTLTVLGLISGTLLAVSFEATEPTIRAYDEQKMREAALEVVPGADTAKPLGEDLAEVAPSEARLFAVYAGETRVGFAIPAQGTGFQDVIKLIYGYDPARRRIVGMKVLDSKETPGLGDKIFKDAAFVAQFSDLATEPHVVPKKQGEASAENEIDCITGATISSKAVARILDESSQAWRDRLGN